MFTKKLLNIAIGFLLLCLAFNMVIVSASASEMGIETGTETETKTQQRAQIIDPVMESQVIDPVMESIEGLISLLGELISRFILFLPRCLCTNPSDMLRLII